MRNPFSFGMMALVVACSFAGDGLAAVPQAGKPFDLRAHARQDAVRPGEVVPVAVVLEIAPGHWVYAKSVEISAVRGSGARIAQESRPQPVAHHDPTSGFTSEVYIGRVVFGLEIELPRELPTATEMMSLTLSVRLTGCGESLCFPPQTRLLSLALPLRPDGESPRLVDEELFGGQEEPSPGYGRMGLVVALVTAFAGGLLLSLTPCIYPLIPITAAVVAAAGGGRSWKRGLALTLIYVTGLSLVYAAAGAAAAKAGGMLGAASRHWAVVTVMAAVFVALAFSLLDVYDPSLPASWRAKLSLGRAGGAVGVFAMGMLSGLLASPCIAGPIAAVLLHISTTGDMVFGALLLFTMAWGMSVLLIAAGTSSGFMSLLPKSGGWMLAVKTALAVVLLVASLYYLRPVLPVGAFNMWYAMPLIVLGVWRGLVVRAPSDASRGRKALKALGLTAVVFGFYFGVGALVRAGMPAPGISALYPGRILAASSRIDFRIDFAAAVSEARSMGRPVMVEFTGENCPACREFESRVLSREDVAVEAQRFVAIRADVSLTPEPTLSRYEVKGVPTVVWIDSRGSMLDRLTVTGGGIRPEEFLRRMREVK